MHEESLFESTLQRRAMHFLDVLHFVWQHTHTHKIATQKDYMVHCCCYLFIYMKYILHLLYHKILIYI